MTQKHLQVSEELTHHYYPRLKMYEWDYELQKEMVRKVILYYYLYC